MTIMNCAVIISPPTSGCRSQCDRSTIPLDTEIDMYFINPEGNSVNSVAHLHGMVNKHTAVLKIIHTPANFCNFLFL